MCVFGNDCLANSARHDDMHDLLMVLFVAAQMSSVPEALKESAFASAFTSFTAIITV